MLLYYFHFLKDLFIFNIVLTISNILSNQNLKNNGRFIYIILLIQGIINLIVFIKNNDKPIDKKTLPIGVLNNKQYKRNNCIVIIPAIIALVIISLLSLIIDFIDVVLYTTLIYILLISILTIISNKIENNKLIIFE